MGDEENADGHGVSPLSIGDAAESAECDKSVQISFYGLIFHRQFDLDRSSRNEGEANACLSICIHHGGCTQAKDAGDN